MAVGIPARDAPVDRVVTSMSGERETPIVPTRRSLVAVWLAVAAASAMFLGVTALGEGGRDDPDPAEQRVGFLDQGPLPLPAPPVVSGLPSDGRATVVVFLRPGDATRLCRQLSRRVSRAAVAAVVSGPASCPGIPAVLVDPEGTTADAYGMRTPTDAGPPVGYAVVDAQNRIRYRTLDPDPAAHSREILTMLAAL